MAHNYHKPILWGIALAFSLLLTPTTIFAQNGPLDLVPGMPLTGNYCVVSAGIGLEEHDPADPQTFTAEVPGMPIASYWFWTERARVDPYDGDPNFILGYNGGANVTITAGQESSSLENSGPWQWHAYHYADEALDYVATGTNTYAISGIEGEGNFEAHGISVVTVYEADSCEYSEIRVRLGLDSFRANYNPNDGEEFGPNSELLCETFDASGIDRTMDLQIIAGGTSDADKLNTLWYVTGTGTPPTASIAPEDGNPAATGATSVVDPLNGTLGLEWDIYNTADDANTIVTIPAGDTHLCIQFESPVDPAEPTNTISALWTGFVSAIPVLGPSALNTMVEPLMDFLTFLPFLGQ